MEKQTVFPVLALAGGAAGAGVRFLNLQTGFDVTTGLPLAGDVSQWFLVGLLVLLTAATFVCSFVWIPKAQHALGQGFYPDTLALGMFVAGALLLIASGGLYIGLGLGVSQMDVLVGGVLAISGLALLSQTTIFAKKTKKGPEPLLFLVPVLGVILLLILDYRAVSINPVIGAYYVEILAYCAVLMSLFQFFAFSAGLGQGRLFCPLATMSIVLSCATLVEGHDLATSVFFVGMATFLLGCLLSYHPSR